MAKSRMLRYLIMPLFLGLGLASTAHAASIQQTEVIPYQCSPTPTLKVNFLPNSEIGTTNNLWRKTGLAIPAVGRPIYIKGIVLDEKCVPVPGAVVQIWQADAEGDYSLGDKENDKNLDPYFGQSGTTYTNNLGEYSFITIFPGAGDNEIPYIRFRVKQRDFKTIRTKMYFPGISSSKDVDYKKLSAKEQTLLTAATNPRGLPSANGKDPTTYYFNIVLKGKVPYKQY